MAKGDRIKYRSGVKYWLAEDYSVQTRITGQYVYNDFGHLFEDGTLFIRAGYAWDGASGPTFDTLNSMRGSLVHDFFYDLMRRGLLSQEWRQAADEELREILLEDGMSEARADAWFTFVRMCAAPCSAVGNDGGKPLCTAP